MTESQVVKPQDMAPAKDSALDQPKDAVQLKAIDATARAEDAGPSTPAKDTNVAPESTSASQGKGTEAAPEAQSAAEAQQTEQTSTHQSSSSQHQKASDSLSIEEADGAATTDGSPVCNITLLLPTGKRHPYRLDEKYLAKRNVEVPELTEAGKKDPFSISVYKLKELILREWRDEWDGKPASPSSIRLIHFGKMLDDKEQLSSKFSWLVNVTLPLVVACVYVPRCC